MGQLIVFEGLDCVGKTSIAKKLQLALDPKSKNVFYNKAKLRFFKILPCTLSYVIDQLIDEYLIVRKSKRRGLVIQDRYFFSAVAYFSAVSGTTILRLVKYLFTKPDLVIYLKASALARKRRNLKRGRRGFQGLFNDLILARQIEDQYQQLIAKYKHITINTTKTSLEDMVQEICIYLGIKGSNWNLT